MAEKEVKQAKAKIRQRQTAYWDNVAEAGKTAKTGEAQTARADKPKEDEDRRAQRMRM
jgi:hypothetical protein